MDQTLDMTDAVKVKTYSFPVEMEALRDVLPKETEARPDDPKFKLTPQSIATIFSQDSILALHWLNLPLKEGAIFVPYLYQQIRAVVEEYQLHHEDAFYEQYPELLVLKKGETTPSGSALRVEHRKYDRRLAHKVWHYTNAAYMYSGSLANLMMMAHMNGEGQQVSFGLSCKIGYINTAANRFGLFPKPLGCLAKIGEYSKFAVGETSYGSTFVSAPWWVTDIFGNRGQHNFSISQLYGEDSEDGDNLVTVDASAADTQRMKVATANAYNVLKLYGYDTVNTSGKHSSYIGQVLDSTGKKNVVPSCPHVENGSVIHTHDSAGISVVMPTNKDGNDMYNGFSYVKPYDGSSGSWNHDNMISRAWDTFNFWQNYIEKYFHDFSEHDSQIRYFFTKVIKVLEESLPTDKFFATINVSATPGSIHAIDARDLRNYMIYKKDNKANTATIIKWAPIIDHDGDEWLDGEFDNNFNRYPIDTLGEADYLKESEVWPRLTPTIFADVAGDKTGAMKPYVFNAMVTPGTSYDGGLFSDNYKEYFGAKAPVGRFASMLDMASSANIDAKNTSVDVLAIDPEAAKKFVKSGDAIIMKARPSTPMVYEQPLIDTTDPFQCGFNIIISHEAKAKNEFSKWYSDSLNYIQDSTDTNPVDVTLPPANWGDGSTGNEFYPTNPSCGKITISGTDYMIKSHAMCEYYFAMKSHLLVFVGDGIFTHPAVAGGKFTAGNPAERFYLSDTTTAGVSFFQSVKAITTTITDNKMEDDSVTDWGEANVMSIMHSMEPHLFNNGDMTEFRTSRELFHRAIDNLQTVVSNVVNQYQQFVFDPAYGPVSPVTYEMPPVGFSGWAPLPYDVDVNQSYTPEDNAAYLKPMVAYKNQGSTDAVDYIPELADIAPRWKPIETSALFWLWFIDSFKYMKIRMVGVTPSVYENPIKIAGCSSFAKALWAMISRTTVFFTGVEDTLPLYEIPEDKMKSREPSIEASVTINLPGTVKTPRVVYSKTTSKGTANVSSTNKSVSTQAERAVNANPDMKIGADNKAGTAKESYSKDKSSKPRKNKKKSKGFKNDSKGSDRFDSKPGDDKSSMYDDSSKGEDEQLKKNLKDKSYVQSAGMHEA